MNLREAESSNAPPTVRFNSGSWGPREADCIQNLKGEKYGNPFRAGFAGKGVRPAADTLQKRADSQMGKEFQSFAKYSPN